MKTKYIVIIGMLLIPTAIVGLAILRMAGIVDGNGQLSTEQSDAFYAGMDQSIRDITTWITAPLHRLFDVIYGWVK